MSIIDKFIDNSAADIPSEPPSLKIIFYPSEHIDCKISTEFNLLDDDVKMQHIKRLTNLLIKTYIDVSKKKKEFPTYMRMQDKNEVLP